jgi:hypothetical protein
MRARKVIYDDYTKAFYVETRVEALERQVATRAKLADVLNRSHDARLKDTTKRVSEEDSRRGGKHNNCVCVCLPACCSWRRDL